MEKTVKKVLKREDYFIKENNEIRKCTKEEYLEYLKQLKQEKAKKLCPNCRVCTCDKIKHSNILKSEGVSKATYSRKIFKTYDNGNRAIPDVYFDVYECSMFEPFKEITYAKLKREVLELYRQILVLEHSITSEFDTKKQEKLTNLKRLREEKLRLIEDKDELFKIKMSEKFAREAFEKKLELAEK